MFIFAIFLSLWFVTGLSYGGCMTKTETTHIQNDWNIDQNHTKNARKQLKRKMLWTILAQIVDAGITYNKEDAKEW